MIGIIRFLVGSCFFSCPRGALNDLLAYMMAQEIPYDRLSLTEDGTQGIFRVYLGDRGRVMASGAPLCPVRRVGLLPLLMRYRRRWGLMLGGVLFALILWLSGQVIWSMEIVGGETIGSLPILEALEQAGCTVGSYIPTLDLWQVEGDVMRAVDGLSFVAVNIDGTHARVEIKEEERRQSDEIEGAPSNLVAARDGQIVRTEVYSGQAVVRVHDVVKKGELLVSGVVNTKVRPDNTFRLERSVGAVYARTTREISVFLPDVLHEDRVETEAIIEKSLIFFGYCQKLFKKAGNLPPKYGIISEKVQWVLFDVLPLPIYAETVRLVSYTQVACRLTEEELRARATDALMEQVSATLAHAEIESYEILEERMEDGMTLTLIAQCIEDIGCEVPIEILP